MVGEKKHASTQKMLHYIGISVGKQNANALHGFLHAEGLLEKGLKPAQQQERVVFPLAAKPSSRQTAQIKKITNGDFRIASAEFGARTFVPRSLRSALQGKLSKKQMDSLIASFDTIGDIAVLEIPKTLVRKEKIIAEALLEVNRSIKTVCRKTGIHKGKYRTLAVKVIAGKKKKKTVHRESGCRFKVELGKMFFSPRLATERMRIAREIREGEIIATLFAGVGPFPIIFAKHSKMEKAYAVELNPHAYKYMLDNIKLNKAEGKVEPILGDVKKVVPAQLAGKCDRAVMPLPKGGENFLREALLCLKPEGGIVHFYQFADIRNPFEKPVADIMAAADALGFGIKILDRRKVRAFSPGIVQVVVDFWAKKHAKKITASP